MTQEEWVEGDWFLTAVGYQPIALCAGCRDGADDYHEFVYICQCHAGSVCTDACFMQKAHHAGCPNGALT